jgi:uncharacterized protein (DUF433 family)
MEQKQLDYKDHIITDPQTTVSKPVVRGTRIPVENVLGRLAENRSMPTAWTGFSSSRPEMFGRGESDCSQNLLF